MQTNKIIPAVFNRIRQGATMLSIMNYKNNHDEIANYSMVFHIDYKKAVVRSQNIIRAYRASTDLERVAKAELLSSYEETLSGKGNSRDTASHAYEPIMDGDGKIISGVRWHSNKARIYCWGFVVHKLVLAPGVYPRDNRTPLIKTKDKLRQLTPVDRFRQFIIIPERFQTLGIEKMQLTHLDLLRELR